MTKNKRDDLLYISFGTYSKVYYTINTLKLFQKPPAAFPDLVTQCPFTAKTAEKLRRRREQRRCRRRWCGGGGRAAQLLLSGLGRRYAYPLQLQPDLQVSVPGGRPRAFRQQLQRRLAAQLRTIADAVRERGGGIGGPYKDGGRYPRRL